MRLRIHSLVESLLNPVQSNPDQRTPFRSVQMLLLHCCCFRALQNFKEPADPYLQYEMLDFQNSDIPVLNDPLQPAAAAAASATTPSAAAAAAVASLQHQRQRRQQRRQCSSTQAGEGATTTAAAATAEAGITPQSSPPSKAPDRGYSSSSSSGSSGVQAGSRADAAGAACSSSTSSLLGSRGSQQAALHTLAPAAAPAALCNQQMQQEQQQQAHQQQLHQLQQQPHLPAQLAALEAQQQVGCGSITQCSNDSLAIADMQHCTAVRITTAQSSRQHQQHEHQLVLSPTLQWQVQQVPESATSGQEDAHCRLENCYMQAL
jgi:hypothetical protein